MEKRLLLAAALSLAVLAAWELLMPKPKRPPQPAPPAAASASGPTPAAEASPAPDRNLPAPVSGRAEEKAVIENGLVRATFSSRGGVLAS
ncbi:MAG TPA: protein translocase component YidC, partial [Thermoanaerobaculia bacterium]|nr:protein translocase component YidC [Thermoanaerobaculia bacterium]